MYRNSTLILRLAAIGAFVTPIISQATLIDDFLPINHDHDRVLAGPHMEGHSITDAFQGNMIGGERDIELAFAAGSQGAGTLIARYEPNPEYHQQPYYRVGGIGPGNAGTGSDTTIILQYDGVGDEIGNIGFDKHLRNGGTGIPLLDGNDGGIRIWYSTQYGGQIPTSVILRREGAEFGRVNNVIGFGRGEFEPALFPFAPDILGQADSISIVISPHVNGNIAKAVFIDRIDTIVPEPAVILAFSIGGLALVFRRPKIHSG